MIFACLLLRFSLIWESNLEPYWPLRCGQDAPKMPPRRLLRRVKKRSARQFSPRPPKWRQNGIPDPPKWCPRPFILDRCWRRFSIYLMTLSQLFCRFWDRFLVSFSVNIPMPSAVAGTQLCCALDPPRQAYGLHMAYRVPYPNVPSHIPFLLISFLFFLSLSI